MGLAIELMGGVRATLNGVPVSLRGRRPSILLACLALADGRALAADRLIDLMWDDNPPMTARRTLQSYVSGLRRSFGGDEGRLSASGAGYLLSIERGEVDLFVFADAVTNARRQVLEDPTDAAARLEAALESWSEPLDGLRPSLALQAIVAPFEELRLEALETLIDVELDHGDAGRAIGRLETLVREQPIRERFWTQLVRGLAALGRRDAALHASQRARESLREHLGVDPSELLQRLEREVLDDGSQRSSSTVALPPGVESDRPGNVIRPATEFIGRITELHRGRAELETRRLVTLTGAGGVGKTRLAIELAWTIVEEFPGGVWLAELTPVADPSAVVAAVAGMLAIPPQRDMTRVESIVDWLQGRRRLLLIVDNCEHVSTPVAELIAAVMAHCPNVVVLATSREPLGVSGERVHLVPPLDPTSAAVELFCARANAADSSFNPNADDRRVITAICKHLDGIPLAIELAASRMRALSPSDLLAHLDERFGLLHGTGRSASDRHQTMRATVEWSYRLLDERERLLFDRLSVFAGGFDLSAVEAVCADGETLHEELVVGVVGSLVDKSLVIADRDSDGVRYRLLQPMRQYGEERLHERAASTQIDGRHLDHYVGVAVRANQVWSSPRQVEADAVLDRDWDNLRAAHAWAVNTANRSAAERLVTMSAPHAWCRLKHEHGDWARRTLTLDNGESRVNSTTHGWAAYWAVVGNEPHHVIEEVARRGIDAAASPEHPDTSTCWAALIWSDCASGYHNAQEYAGHARVAAAASTDRFVRCWVLSAVVEAALGTHDVARADLLTSLASLTDTIGSPSLRARTTLYQGWEQQSRGRSGAEAALACYRKALDQARQAGDVINANVSRLFAVRAGLSLQVPEAGQACRAAMTLFHDTRHWTALWLTVGAVARWWQVAGMLDRVAVIYGHMNVHHPPYHEFDGLLRRNLAVVGEQPGAGELMARGAAMDRDQLVTYVLDHLPPDVTQHNP